VYSPDQAQKTQIHEHNNFKNNKMCVNIYVCSPDPKKLKFMIIIILKNKNNKTTQFQQDSIETIA
jgi:hypothetical protein